VSAHGSGPGHRLTRQDRLLRSLISLVVVLVVVGLGVAYATGQFSGSNGHAAAGPAPSLPSPVTSSAATPASSPTAVDSPSPSRARRHHRPSRSPSPTVPVVSGHPLAGLTVGVDPGHNGGNFSDPSYINRPIWNGREHEACNTTGTETDAGYTEARYNLNVATYLVADLRAAGANVVMTRTSNTGVGPCVNRRAQIINAAHAAVAIDIHADGGPASGRGFTVLEPVADGPNDGVVSASRAYGTDLRNAFETTGMPTSTYDGTDGVNFRDDLAGLNLTTVPQVLLECGNMRNATDAKLLTSPAFQRKAAGAIMAGMATFLSSQRH
jgi:N-acetylmuramoyl-L-alanine amidase